MPKKMKKVVMRLKPERVQELLLKLTGWRLQDDGLGLENVRTFTSGQSARSHVSRICKLAEEARQPVQLRFAGSQVILTLQGQPGKGINTNVFKLAGQIG